MSFALRSKIERISISSNYRVNHRIRAPQVRLIDHNGDNHGVVSIKEARDIAEEAELDLVEVAPNANPPVVRVMDYGKFIYEKTRKEREARKHQKQVEIKTIKLSPKIAAFHRDLNVRKARGWLLEGKKVKVVVRFRGREITYPELGQDMMNGVAEELKEVSTIEQRPNLEGWSMVMMLAPLD
ncbi:MAG TPA: translation initiation factor IF-3 [Anaerolineae bacterium]|nr:translation initiation factor IF-3 [Anaerolineae bacterium]